MARSRPCRGPWRRALPPLCALAALPVLLVVAFAAQLAFATSMPWETALRVSLHHWFVPFLVFVVGWAVARGFPVERGRLRWAVPMHLAVGTLVVALAGRVEMRMFPASQASHGAAQRWHGAPPPPHEAPLAPIGSPGLPGDSRGRHSAPSLHGHFLAMIVSSRWQLHLAVLAVSMSVTHAWRFHQRVQERDRRTLELTAGLSRAKLEALRLRLQPHFLFNTLNTVSNLVHRNADAADEMITNLSELLRLSLDVGEQEVPLRRELEILDCYLAIEQVRLGRQLRIERQIFLDIQMPEMDGFDVPRRLGRELPVVIFVTAFDRYAVKAFEVHALDYLLKPFKPARLAEAVAPSAETHLS